MGIVSEHSLPLSEAVLMHVLLLYNADDVDDDGSDDGSKDCFHNRHTSGIYAVIPALTVSFRVFMGGTVHM